MSNYIGKLNLLKFKNSCIITVKGNATKRGIFIPIDDNNLFVTTGDDQKARGAYVDFMAWENQQPGKYGDTHGIRQSLPKEVRERMTEEQLKAAPYFGNMKPYEMQNASQTVEAPATQVEETTDELPF